MENGRTKSDGKSFTDFFTPEIIFAIIVGISFSLYVTVCLVAFTLKSCFMSCFSPRKFGGIAKKPKRVLFVIAHPDDECMFFGPTIMNFVQSGKRNVFVLCLSNGNYEGLGKRRKEELWLSCRTLGILSSNVTLLKYDRLQDDPNLDWPTDVIGRAIVDHIHSHDIETLITFDGRGVSGHKNHIAINKAVKALIAQKHWPKFCDAFELESVNYFRMYFVNFLDLALSYASSQFTYFVDLYQRAYIVEAMECHVSQLLWFRKLYIVFSRYMLINTLNEIYAAKPEDPIPVKDKDKDE